jgi:hypothetical protein
MGQWFKKSTVKTSPNNTYEGQQAKDLNTYSLYLSKEIESKEKVYIFHETTYRSSKH